METCGKAIVLLMDRSASIKNEDWVHQVEATANALEHPEVMPLIIKNQVAFKAMWFNSYVSTITDWQILKSEAEVHAFANQMRAYVRPTYSGRQKTEYSTNMALALQEAARSLTEDTPESCRYARQVIDITTDGEPDDELNAHTSSQIVAQQGITINGIAIANPLAYNALERFVTTHHTGGRTFQSEWKNFHEIIKEKLIMELLSDASHGQPRYAHRDLSGNAEISAPPLPASRSADISRIVS